MVSPLISSHKRDVDDKAYLQFMVREHGNRYGVCMDVPAVSAIDFLPVLSAETSVHVNLSFRSRPVRQNFTLDAFT
jgi:hypothetical protein